MPEKSDLNYIKDQLDDIKTDQMEIMVKVDEIDRKIIRLEPYQDKVELHHAALYGENGASGAISKIKEYDSKIGIASWWVSALITMFLVVSGRLIYDWFKQRRKNNSAIIDSSGHKISGG